MTPGLKYDAGKAPWSLLMRGCGHALASVVDVLQFGARKYAPDSWQRVPNAETRYRDALYRHMAAIEQEGPQAIDPETGLLHWSHVACNALFLTHLAIVNAEPAATAEPEPTPLPRAPELTDVRATDALGHPKPAFGEPPH